MDGLKRRLIVNVILFAVQMIALFVCYYLEEFT